MTKKIPAGVQHDLGRSLTYCQQYKPNSCSSCSETLLVLGRGPRPHISRGPRPEHHKEQDQTLFPNPLSTCRFMGDLPRTFKHIVSGVELIFCSMPKTKTGLFTLNKRFEYQPNSLSLSRRLKSVIPCSWSTPSCPPFSKKTPPSQLASLERLSPATIQCYKGVSPKTSPHNTETQGGPYPPQVTTALTSIWVIDKPTSASLAAVFSRMSATALTSCCYHLSAVSGVPQASQT